MKTIIFDMYGVIIKESKGYFIPYTFNHFDKSEHERLTRQFREEKVFTKASNGEISSDELFTHLGYCNPQFHMRDYIENHLTIDMDFYKLAENINDRYRFALLSNDVSEWSKYITDFYDLNKYFSVKIISGDVNCRKPDKKIYDILLDKLNVKPQDCIFIDNNVDNLNTAENLGIETILFNRDNEFYSGKTAYSFNELLNLL